jgi:uncharacterized protein involved in response to NO
LPASLSICFLCPMPSTTEAIIRQWKTFSAAPHRMMFFGGMIQSLCVMAWWLVDLGGRYGRLYAPVAWSVPAPDAHSFLMLYGFFPFFIFGFLMTTYPRWMNGEEVERSFYVPAFVLLAAGIVMFYLGLLDRHWLVPAALSFLAGWAVGLYALLRVYWRAQSPDKRHAHITSTVLVFGWLLTATWFAGEISGSTLLVNVAKTCGVWLLLLPVFFAVSHRMIPFFSANVIPDFGIVRPYWALGLVSLGCLLHAVLELSAQPAWLWLVDLPMAVTAFYLTLAWRFASSLRVPLLGMLHIGFAWLGIALMLYGVQSLALLAGHVILGKAPLHALAAGYFASMVLGMITRVTLGHSGRSLSADRLTWTIFLVFQSVAVLRIVAELPGMAFVPRTHLYLCAALLWLVCFGAWAFHYIPVYWRPRTDGKPG